jgi:hypothetical protein
MSVSIISCPECKQLILSDTVQCPTCQHVLDEERAKGMVIELPSVAKAAEDEIACPDCGEMVRSGLVRCWRCGGFLREEIAETYQKMLDAPKPVTYSQTDAPPDETAKKAEERAPEVADDDDFELAPGLDLMSEEQHSRQKVMNAKVAKDAAKAEVQTAADSETYGLNAPAAPETAESTEATTPAATPAPAAPAPAAKTEETTKTETTKADEKPAESESAKPAAKKPESSDPMDVGADALLEIAKQEEQEAVGRRKTRAKEKAGKDKVAMPGFLFVYCPNGHQIQVDENKRGMTGRCPRCKSFFHVPALDWKKEKEDEVKSNVEAKKESRFADWMLNAHLHQLDPTKLKLKPGSLEKDFFAVDFGFAPGEWLLVGHGKQGAGFAKSEKNPKKLETLRAELQEYLRLDKEILDLPASGYRQYNEEELAKLQIVQPAAYAHESMFAGVPVFGEGRIAVRMPITGQDADITDILFMSFSLSEFRKLSTTLKEYGIDDFGATDGVPLEDEETIAKCHYSDREIKSISATTYHNADPDIELVVVGRKCHACSLVVSEDSRKKEKLGGAAGKGIAKAECPKCKQKFGSNTLFGVKTDEEQPDNTLSETGGLSS